MLLSIDNWYKFPAQRAFVTFLKYTSLSPRRNFNETFRFGARVKCEPFHVDSNEFIADAISSPFAAAFF